MLIDRTTPFIYVYKKKNRKSIYLFRLGIQSKEDGDMSFEDFLDMMSTFSENAPKSVKLGKQLCIIEVEGGGGENKWEDTYS